MGWFLNWVFSLRRSEVRPLVRRLFAGPFVLVGTLTAVSISLNHLGVGHYAQKLLDSKTLIILALVWASWAVINLYKSYKQEDHGYLANRGCAIRVAWQIHFSGEL